MKTHALNKPADTASGEPKAKNQASSGAILQAYKTAQLASDEEPVQQKENKTGLPDQLKTGVENLSGHSLDDVKVHYNSPQPAALQAHAYAQGTDIHVAPGQEKHLPHEAWHVVQQKQERVQPTKQLKGTTNINDDAGLEKEADVMGAKAMNDQSENTNQLNSSPYSSNVMQYKTEVEHTSIHQDYFTNDDITSQVMGVEMNAVIDPWNPLHGTDTGAFTRHGIYLDSTYKDNDQRATAMHLLNANLGGLAVDENLFPGTTNKNGQHLKSGETQVKNKVLTLIENAKSNDSWKNWRVGYKVKFNPPSVLRPENWKDVKLSLGHAYINEEGKAVSELEMFTNVYDDPNEDLATNNWTNNNSKGGVSKNNRKYPHNTTGDRATFIEKIEHNQDKTNGSVRYNKHLAHEDYNR